MRKNYFKTPILLIVLLLSAVSLGAKESNYKVYGKIVNQKGEPMSAVIVEIENTDIYTLSEINGNFCLDTKGQSLPETIIFRFVDYYTRRINVTSQMATDSLFITLFPGDDAQAKKLSTKEKIKYGGFGISASYSFIDANFDNFSEMSDNQKAQLNTNSHFFGFGIEADIFNVYCHLNFGFAPVRKTLSSQYRHLTDAYAISFDIGYTFPFFKQKILLLTPYVGINHLLYNEYIAPLNHDISLGDFLSQGYVDYSMLQYTASFGAKLAIKIAEFGRYNQHGIYLSASAAYNLLINSHPYVYSKSTDIYTTSSISIFPVTAQATIIYKIGPKIK